MSIASRITSIEGHISDIYDSVELTGVDTTDIDKNLVNVPNTLKEGYIDIINNGTDTLYNNFPKVSGEGTSLTLNNTYQAPMRNNLKGNTSQTGTPTPTNPIPVNVVSGDNEIEICGKNLFDKNSVITGKYYTSEGTTTSTTNAYCELLNINENETYSIKIENKYSSTVRLNIFIYDKNMSMLSYMRWGHNLGSNQSYTNENYTMPVGAKFISISIIDMPPTTENIDKVLIMFNLGSTSLPYEPYQGNTYNIDLPVENLFKNRTSSTTSQTVNITPLADGGIKLEGTSGAGFYTVLVDTSNAPVLTDGTYIRSVKVVGTITKNGKNVLITGRDSNNANTMGDLAIRENSIATKTSTITGTHTMSSIGLYVDGAGVVFNCTIYIQIEQGDKANSYTPYGTTPIELCKIGNYQDYFYKDSDKWYLHKEIGKVTYNGTENWMTFAINYEYQIILQDAKEGDFENQFFPSLCNKYVNHNVGGASLNNYEFSNFTSGVYRWIRIRHNDITTIANYKTWLASNTPTFYYLLATPTNTEITYQPLIDQLDALEQAKSKENQTNISQINNDLGFIISASALKKGV